MGYTINLHRVLKAPGARVYKAFLDPAALCKWLPPAGYTCSIEKLDAKVGGTFRMAFTEFDSGSPMGFGGTYLELVPNAKIRYNDVFDDPNLPGEIMVTIEFKDVIGGTELKVQQANIPDVIPAEMCYLGWQDSLKQLAQLVELGAPPTGS